MLFVCESICRALVMRVMWCRMLDVRDVTSERARETRRARTARRLRLECAVRETRRLEPGASERLRDRASEMFEVGVRAAWGETQTDSRMRCTDRTEDV